MALINEKSLLNELGKKYPLVVKVKKMISGFENYLHIQFPNGIEISALVPEGFYEFHILRQEYYLKEGMKIKVLLYGYPGLVEIVKVCDLKWNFIHIVNPSINTDIWFIKEIFGEVVEIRYGYIILKSDHYFLLPSSLTTSRLIPNIDIGTRLHIQNFGDIWCKIVEIESNEK